MKDNNSEQIELTLPFTVVCVNDKNRPPEIPPHKWIKEGQTYTVIKVGITSDGKPGFILEEIELGKDTFPYDLWSPKRFGIPVADESEAEEAVKNLMEEVTGAEA